MSPLLIIWGTSVVLMAAGIVTARRVGLSGHAARRRARRRALMRVPETAIAAVEDGEKVRLRGRAVARGPLRTSPLSQRPCIGFRLIVEDLRNGARSVDEEEFDSFVLTDGTAEALVHAPFQLELDPYDAREVAGDDVRSANVPPALYELVKQSGVQVTTFGRPDALRYVETLLQPGDEIIAVGRATIELDPAGRAPSHRERPVRCHLKGADKRVVIADADEP